MSQLVKENNIPVDKIYKIGQNYTWSLDFYNKHPVQLTTLEEVQEKHDVWVYAEANELTLLRDSGLEWNTQYSVDHFRITRLQAKFLNPKCFKPRNWVFQILKSLGGQGATKW
jgi:hypothetical protein